MQQLDSIQLEWNTHRLRKSHLAQAPGGIPDILYDCPELSGIVYNSCFCYFQLGVSRVHRLEELYTRCR